MPLPQQETPSAKIIGGTTTDITSVPYLVSILYNGVHDCGGSLVSPIFVLTAAHCIYRRRTTQMLVRAGSSDATKGGVISKVHRMIYHKSYNSTSFDHDVALLKLGGNYSRFLSRNSISLIPLANGGEALPSTGLIAGWGLTNENIGKLSKILRSVTVNIYNSTDCTRYLTGYAFTANMFCAGDVNGGKDSCQGDSGGPLSSNGKLYGIVSWGVGCGRRGLPGVYTSVPQHRTWINNIMSKYAAG
ncbi:trypsin 3A1-like isoform X2 [Condylostylus longicornis]|uniref:trypsin 3A1-like isoform X2 n=1 Tax=Condylostylus longicornis TaxID=2530218 RepID=UPI00244D9C6A|nr:trypsin 3A1-like isoform X2 [Condylostylus longicornis]